jgi:hypothetical protein
MGFEKEAEALRSGAGLLTEEQRLAFEMKYGLGADEAISYAQLAEKLGVSLSSSKRIVRHAKFVLGLIEKRGPETEEPAKPEDAEPPHPWLKKIRSMSTADIELLEMTQRGLDDLRIGQELGIGGAAAAKELRQRIAGVFDCEPLELEKITPEILRLAGEII